MLNYKPSIGQNNGNDTPVSVREDGTLYGASIGSKIIHSLRKPTYPNNTVSTELTDTSTWFYKQVTDYNFINGQEYYRVLYIGADPNSDENEVIGTIKSSITNDFVTSDPDVQELIDNSLSIEIWNEGKFNFASHVNNNGGLLLEDESDSTDVLGMHAIWRDEIDINKTVIPGEYYKIWIKITPVQNEDLLEYDDFIYNIKVGGLVIPIKKQKGRLNISSIYSVSLDDQKDYILEETLPKNIKLKEVIKVIQKQNDINVFYFNDDSQLNLLTIKPNQDIQKNKYINTNLHDIVGDIKESQSFTYSNFSKCITMTTSGSSGTSGTSGTSGSPTVVDELLDNKFIVDVFASDKELNIFYIPYNEFVTESDQQYVTRYGHKQYNWNTGFIKVDMRNVNDSLFDKIEENNIFELTLVDNTCCYKMQESHYWESAIFIDDLFILSGFDVEDCRSYNNRSFLSYVWEKDIILNTPNYQKTQIPKSSRNVHRTVPNRANTAAYLDFSVDQQIDKLETYIDRSVETLMNGVDFVRTGPPHRTSITHGLSSITYDIPLEVDEFSVTWSFGIDPDNSSIVTTAPSGYNPGTTGTSSSPSTGTSGTSGTGTTGSSAQPPLILPEPILPLSPYYLHILKQKDYDDYISDPYPLNNPFGRFYKDTFNSIFKINCNGNEQNPAISVEYNFHDNVWKIITEDINAEWVRNIIHEGPPLSLDFDNVITVNTWRKQVYGCGKKYMLNFNIYLNGVHLVDGITYTDTTTHSYVLTHNHDEEFTGHLSYLEVRNGLLLEGNKYATTMFQILSNIAWAEKETEIKNSNSVRGLEFFSYKSNYVINNLNWDNDDDFLFPIVLQGNSFNVGPEYNYEVRRTIFDFNKINVNDPSFAFTMEGTSNQLDWFADKYDFNNDTMVVWVRLRDWRGQRISMYYGDIRVIKEQRINKIYTDFYGLWTMNEFQDQAQSRFYKTQIFDGGEPMLVVANENGIFTMQIDKQYFFGNQQVYKNNNFDITYDDRNVHRNREDFVNQFIRDTVALFKPGTMNLRDIKSIYPYKIESDNTGGAIK